MIPHLLLGLASLLFGGVMFYGGYRSLKTGEFRARGGGVVRRKKNVFAFLALVYVNIVLGTFVLIGGLISLIMNCVHH